MPKRTDIKTDEKMIAELVYRWTNPHRLTDNDRSLLASVSQQSFDRIKSVPVQRALSQARTDAKIEGYVEVKRKEQHYDMFRDDFFIPWLTRDETRKNIMNKSQRAPFTTGYITSDHFPGLKALMHSSPTNPVTESDISSPIEFGIQYLRPRIKRFVRNHIQQIRNGDYSQVSTLLDLLNESTRRNARKIFEGYHHPHTKLRASYRQLLSKVIPIVESEMEASCIDVPGFVPRGLTLYAYLIIESSSKYNRAGPNKDRLYHSILSGPTVNVIFNASSADVYEITDGVPGLLTTFAPRMK